MQSEECKVRSGEKRKAESGEPKAAICCWSVAAVLPILLPVKSLAINTCCRVADFPDLSIKWGVQE